MAVTVLNIIPAKPAEDAQTSQYTAVNCRTLIDKFTATNVSAVNQWISVNLVPSGGTADADNLIVDKRVIAPGEAYTFPELVGHAIMPGGFISTLASAVDAVVIRATGRELV